MYMYMHIEQPTGAYTCMYNGKTLILNFIVKVHVVVPTYKNIQSLLGLMKNRVY